MRSLLALLLAVVALSATAVDGAPPCVYPYATGAPYAGAPNHGTTTPSFQWGWFGAERQYPRVQWSRGYNNELMRWSLHPRY